jgi:hypothetical protein
MPISGKPEIGARPTPKSNPVRMLAFCGDKTRA